MSAGRGLRVAVDARALDVDFLRTQGIGRYAHSLLGPLAEVAGEHGGELVLLRSSEPAGGEVYVARGGGGPATEVRVRRPPVPGRLADLPEQALLGRDARRAGADVLHALSIYRAAATRRPPLVVTVHDVIPLLFRDLYLRTGLLHRMLYGVVRRAGAVIAVSHAAAADIERELGVPGARIAVVHEAAGAHFEPTPDPGVARRLGLRGPYLLYVGGLANPDPRKDVEGLIDAFAAWSKARGRDETLVLCGRTGPAAEPLRERARATGAAIAFTGFVSDGELPALITGASCAVTATRYEGFGLPALEALACGTPVAAYEAGALPEVAGPGALLVAPGDGATLMAAAGRICDEPDLRARLAERGREHARGFSWERAARETWDVYERVAGGRA